MCLKSIYVFCIKVKNNFQKNYFAENFLILFTFTFNQSTKVSLGLIFINWCIVDIYVYWQQFFSKNSFCSLFCLIPWSLIFTFLFIVTKKVFAVKGFHLWVCLPHCFKLLRKLFYEINAQGRITETSQK